MNVCSCNCSHDDPIAILKAEHRVIERVLTALERFAAQDRIAADAFHGAIDFLRNFADGCHHAKEENELFPRLEVAGVPRRDGPIGCMLDEHERGRALMRRMSESVDAAARGDENARRTLRLAVAEYVSLLREHIMKEDQVLFELADRMFSHTDRKALFEGFERTERHEANAGKHELYLRLAETLHQRAQQLGPPAQEGVVT
jgi:hemerythrin-like domain-containing protein